MKLKKFIPLFLLTLSLGMAIPAFPANINPGKIANSSSNDVRAQKLVSRLQEIRNMDKSNLTSSEKKALRKEVKEIRKEMREDRGGSGIYISVGAAIIILLLLIILLR